MSPRPPCSSSAMAAARRRRRRVLAVRRRLRDGAHSTSTVSGGFIELARARPRHRHRRSRGRRRSLERCRRRAARAARRRPHEERRAGRPRRARRRHQGVRIEYGRALGVHPTVLALAEDRGPRGDRRGGSAASTRVVLVGRGSSDPDANATSTRSPASCRTTAVSGWWSRRSSPWPPRRRRRHGAVPSPGRHRHHGRAVLPVRRRAARPDRTEARHWAADHPEVDVHVARHFGPVPELAHLVLERYDEAASGEARMNCDCCAYRTALPGFESRVGQPLVLNGHRHRHDHDHEHEH